MKPYLFAFYLITASLVFSQSYVDSGIRHFNVGEYEEALIDFENAAEIQDMLTEAAKAKIFYYRGLVRLKQAEKAKSSAEQDFLMLAYADLQQVLSKDKNMELEVSNAYKQLNALLLEEAEDLLKQEKKADEVDQKLSILDRRIEYLVLAKKLEVSSLVDLYLGETNKQAGDIIFERATSVTEMQRAKAYYEEAIKYLEIARYDDPFSKDIIKTLITLAERLGDVDRLAEYQKLLDLAGG
ncbi:hypothetical protein [Ekhidna sp.]|uniref:hypothetical protein n=1 Tax=Ekhidna sp. TaxID=2608089 RepID=UPI003CCB9B2B